MEIFTIDVPSLRSLTVWNTSGDPEPGYSLLVIHSHSLNVLDVVDEWGEVNVMGEMSELVEASLNTLATRGNVLGSLTFAKRLSLTLALKGLVICLFFLFFLLCDSNNTCKQRLTFCFVAGGSGSCW